MTWLKAIAHGFADIYGMVMRFLLLVDYRTGFGTSFDEALDTG